MKKNLSKKNFIHSRWKENSARWEEEKWVRQLFNAMLRTNESVYKCQVGRQAGRQAELDPRSNKSWTCLRLLRRSSEMCRETLEIECKKVRCANFFLVCRKENSDRRRKERGFWCSCLFRRDFLDLERGKIRRIGLFSSLFLVAAACIINNL